MQYRPVSMLLWILTTALSLLYAVQATEYPALADITIWKQLWIWQVGQYKTTSWDANRPMSLKLFSPNMQSSLDHNQESLGNSNRWWTEEKGKGMVWISLKSVETGSCLGSGDGGRDISMAPPQGHWNRNPGGMWVMKEAKAWVMGGRCGQKWCTDLTRANADPYKLFRNR